VNWDSVDWADIFRRLVLFAFKRRQGRGITGSLADAEDIAAEAIRRLLDSEYAGWDPKLEPDLLRHLGSTVNGLISNESRSARLKVERSLSDPSVFRSAERVTASGDKVEEGDECQRALQLLEVRVADDELMKRLLSLENGGVTKPATQATQLKVSVEVIYRARRRLARHREAVRRELEGQGSSANGVSRAQNLVRS
jgi:DNA-directed RNA polymerase specialized sigma24 family protein